MSKLIRKTPEIRFKGFTEDWEQRKLGEVAEFFNEKRIPIDAELRTSGMYPYYGASGVIDYVDNYIFDGEYILLAEDGANIIMRNSPLVYITKGKFWLNNHAHIMRMENGDNNFLLQLLEKQNYVKYNTGTAQPKLNGEVVKKMFLKIPFYEEQTKIGTFFKEIDSLITLHQRKLDALEQLKEGYLQNMFPQKGKTVPKVRFANFRRAWEQRKLGEFGYFYYGRSAPKWSITEDAKIPCVRYGELYTKHPEKINKIYSYTNIPKKNLKFSTGNEVLIPRVGEDPLDFANCAWLSIPNVAIGEMISVFNTEQNPLFTSYMFNSKLKYEFAKRVEGGNVSNLYYSYLEDIPISYPSLEEQIKITSLFEEISNLITLHQNKVEKLQSLKKVYLQKMFT